MNQQVGDKYNRIVLFFTDRNFNHTAVLLCHNAMNRKRDCHPLILLDTAVIMCIQVSHLRVLIHRILLQVKTRRINVGAKNAHTIFQRLLSDLEQHQHLLHAAGINLITRFKLFTCFLHFLQAHIACCTCKADGFRRTLTLCFSCVQEFFVASRQGFQLRFLLLAVGQPCIFFHISSSF